MTSAEFKFFADVVTDLQAQILASSKGLITAQQLEDRQNRILTVLQTIYSKIEAAEKEIREKSGG